MRIRTFMLASAALAALTVPALAQLAPSPAEFEGPITSLSSTDIEVFTSKANTTGASYSTPTRENLSISRVLGCTSFAGRKVIGDNAWNGGTGIVAGTALGTDITAESVFLEPAENVLIGQITAVPSDGGKFMISGTEVVVMPKADPANPDVAGTKSFPEGYESSFSPCIPGLGVKNEFGFEIPVTTLNVGQDAVAEGWYSNNGDKIFYAFLIDGVGQPDTAKVPMQVSINRAQCRERTAVAPFTVEWEIRGGTASPAAGTVNIGYGTRQTATATADPANPPFGAWLYKSRLTGQSTGCPNNITVSYTNADPDNPAATKTVTATSAVEVRR